MTRGLVAEKIGGSSFRIGLNLALASTTTIFFGVMAYALFSVAASSTKMSPQSSPTKSPHSLEKAKPATPDTLSPDERKRSVDDASDDSLLYASGTTPAHPNRNAIRFAEKFVSTRYQRVKIDMAEVDDLVDRLAALPSAEDGRVSETNQLDIQVERLRGGLGVDSSHINAILKRPPPDAG